MSTTSWEKDDPFKFSRHLYAPTVTTNSSGGFSSAAPSNVTRHTYSKSNFRRFPKYPKSHHSDNKSLRSLTYASSLKSGPSYKQHRYYESASSVPSSHPSVAPLPTTTLNPPKIPKKRWYNSYIIWIKILSICLLIALFILSLKYNHKISHLFDPYLSVIKKDHYWGLGLFSIMLFVSILLMLPQEMLIINGCIMISMIWGKDKGLLITISIVWSINFVASILCYFYGQFLMQRVVKELLQKYKVFEMVEVNIFDINGWKFVSLLRILPMNTYSLMNYILGFTSLDFCGLMISNLAILPNVILYCLIGIYSKNENEIYKILFITMIVEIIICVIPILWWIAWIYWNISNEYDKVRESMIMSRPDDVWNEQNQQRQSRIIEESNTIFEQDLNDNVSNL